MYAIAQLPTTQHLLGPFAGLRVCMTGFTDSKTRTSLPEAIQKGGGKYTADMFKNSTHLVARTRDSEKYK
jgi:NAD-dependent DNA ligase